MHSFLELIKIFALNLLIRIYYHTIFRCKLNLFIATRPVQRMQSTVQMILVLICAVSVPWMLLTRPLVLRRRYQKAQLEKNSHHPQRLENDEHPIINSTDDEGAHFVEDEDEEEFDFGEV